MCAPFLFIVISLLLSSPFSSSTLLRLTKGLSLSVEKPNNVLISANGVFSSGFYQVGKNAYCFAIWYSQSLDDGNHTVVWMANRDTPVNGRRSKLSLLKTGNIILTDVDQRIWATETTTTSLVQLELYDTGNLVLHTLEGKILWQSFNSPTDTLLPLQPLTQNTMLVSSRSQSNYSSGFYKLYFDDDNVLRLQFDDLEKSSFYWPSPWAQPWDLGRITYNNSRIAVLDPSGHFKSSDNFKFSAADLGTGPKRRLTVDVDGNLRLYSLNKGAWVVTWQAMSNPCSVHGICGPNSVCNYHRQGGRRCNCIPGFKMKNHTDWSYGCEPYFNVLCDEEAVFKKHPHLDFYSQEIGYSRNVTFESCKEMCSQSCNCIGFQYKFEIKSGYYLCYAKALLLDGTEGIEHTMYIKLPKSKLSSFDKPTREFRLDCSQQVTTPLYRNYKKKQENSMVKFMLWFACGCGGVEIIGFLFVLYVLYKDRQGSRATEKGYLQVGTGFRKYTYAELKKATRNFSIEIGRGGSGVVYKGTLSDNRVAAIKRLTEANQGEEEFLAEVSTIGRLNHMNLTETWGYCVEGKHRLLVYEYMEHSSLAENITSNTLDWKKRFEIALGTAKGLAYLHEECLEWVLHCDVKPHNILLDSNYQPKVADFGMSKLFNRGGIGNSSFSRMRGTRGYMAPEWVYNLPITSKVDVYSYGVVMLEMITGRSPTATVHAVDDNEGMEQRRLVTWVRKKMHETTGNGSWIEEIIDTAMDGEYDKNKMELLVRVALQCAEEDKNARPTMSKVVEMLLAHENDEFEKSSIPCIIDACDSLIFEYDVEECDLEECAEE
ncbi:putative receptor protein kinase ZmPK1 [Cornus florida]|uniref:putative receptor protein kinase ZmPK1 n=1 Tax=Cornus florida TaxID=4283 RepID=UPI0028975000|nr:putative receptor protein kinase ZmPK1 [Cornus florida]